MIDESNRKITLTVNGKPRSVTKMEAMVMRLFEKALKGDPHSIKTVLSYCTTFDLEDAAELWPRPLTEEEEAYHFGRLREEILGGLQSLIRSSLEEKKNKQDKPDSGAPSDISS